MQTQEKDRLPAKKADFVLAFTPLYLEVAQRYKILENANGRRPPLSQMNDVYTGTLALYLGAEVRKFGGNEVEARGQCFQMTGAGIMKLRESMDSTESMLPYLGLVIVGHKWELFLALGDGREANDPNPCLRTHFCLLL